jgi:exopolyphosphatase/guanosine-5'-triphosphate,3'-diphosphate pyrophosphatase
MILASIDLGTNTCNLNIADWSPKETIILHSEKQPIKLGADGFPGGNIPDPAIQRVLNVLLQYKDRIAPYNPVDIKIFATSGLRNAKNQSQICDYIQKNTGLEINIISGIEEAKFIYQGVKQAVPMDEKTYLLLDIGGGSNEIQIASMEKVYWRTSVDLGIARLLDKFRPSDPLTTTNIEQINNYLEKEMNFLLPVVMKYHPEILIGSSGSFDTFASLYINNVELIGTYKDAAWYEIPVEEWNVIYEKLINSTYTERLNFSGMDIMRVEMIPLAAVFTQFLINLFNIKELIRSAYALKEGVIQEMAGNL